MTRSSVPEERRAERLLRWYPRDWRSRYGDEFVGLLIAELEERPRSLRRTADVIGSGLLARCTTAGLTGQGLEGSEQVRASLAVASCALAAFLSVGIALWAQLTIGWQWAPPSTVATTAAMLGMSVTMLVFLALALLGAVPIGWRVVSSLVRADAPGLRGPAALFALGLGVLIVGGRHFGNGWPGTGGHPWSVQGLIPGGVAAFTWASTLSFSSYWVHPGALGSFPAAELAWMAISPVAIVCLVAGAAKTVRRVDLSCRVLRYEARLGAAAVVNMVLFALGSASWIVDGGPGPRDLFHAGAIDVLGLVVMTLALCVAHRALRRARWDGLAVLSR